VAAKTFSNYDAGFSAYENGKHRRYEILFAVNGGAFALAKLFHGETANPVPNPPTLFLGGLSIDHVALGMIAFTVIMFIDIAAFGHAMRRWDCDLGHLPEEWGVFKRIFSLIGLIVLFALCALISGAWYLVQAHYPRDFIFLLAALLILLVLSAGWYLVMERRMIKLANEPRRS
jgi:hypothetical protein